MPYQNKSICAKPRKRDGLPCQNSPRCNKDHRKRVAPNTGFAASFDLMDTTVPDPAERNATRLQWREYKKTQLTEFRTKRDGSKSRRKKKQYQQRCDDIERHLANDASLHRDSDSLQGYEFG